MHRSAASTPSNLRYHAHQPPGKRRKEERKKEKDAQDEPVPALALPDVPREAAHAAHAPEGRGERLELVFGEVRGEAVDVDVGGLVFVGGVGVLVLGLVAGLRGVLVVGLVLRVVVVAGVRVVVVLVLVSGVFVAGVRGRGVGDEMQRGGLGEGRRGRGARVGRGSGRERKRKRPRGGVRREVWAGPVFCRLREGHVRVVRLRVWEVRGGREDGGVFWVLVLGLGLSLGLVGRWGGG